jgi:small subunit ribosomal protein S17
MSTDVKASRKTTKVGLVTSSAADKSIVVKVENLIMHPLYSKFVRTSSKFMAHDEVEIHGARRRERLQRG